jgi:subtilase family serine protease
VAADADPSTGLRLVSVVNGRTTYSTAGGTSASAPLWAGIIALADQYAGRRLGFVNAGLYRIGASPAYHQAFHDITAGPLRHGLDTNRWLSSQTRLGSRHGKGL